MRIILSIAAITFQQLILASTIADCFSTQEGNLKRLMIEKCSINEKIRPVVNFSQPLFVSIYLGPMHFRSLNDRIQRFEILSELDLEWHHPCVGWNTSAANATASQWSDVESIEETAEKTWHPSIQFINSAEDISLLETLNTITKVYFKPDGSVTWPIVTGFAAFCEIKFKKFPFDEQTCELTFEPWQPNTTIALQLASSEIETGQNFISPSEVWSFVSANASMTVEVYAGYDGLYYHRAHFSFVLRRRSAVYAINVFFPSLSLFALLLSTGIMPPKLADRSIFCVTVVLANAVSQTVISESIPKSSEINYIVIFLTVHVAAGVLISFYTILACEMARKPTFADPIKFKLAILKPIRITAVRLFDSIFYGSALISVAWVDSYIFGKMLEE